MIDPTPVLSLAAAAKPPRLQKPSEIAAHALTINAASIALLSSRMGASFDRAVELILDVPGRVVVSGIGKSGLVARKIVATMSSLGTPALFVHAADAAHGDLGMIRAGDAAVLLSSSGESEEVVGMIPYLKRIGVPIVAITGNEQSLLARYADAILDGSIEREACSHNLAPTTSTLVAMALGDALAIALGSMRGFAPADFARYHPGGKLGARLTSTVRDAMHREKLPICAPSSGLREMLPIMSAGKLGLALVMVDGMLCGIATDGDVRRALERTDEIARLTAADVMKPDPMTVGPDVTLFDADEMMRTARITALVVVDPRQQVLGVFQIHD